MSNKLLSPPMLPLYSREDIRLAETRAFAAVESFAVMSTAARAAGEEARQMLKRDSRPILLIAGPGNNGGDGILCGAFLVQEGRRVELLFLGDKETASDDVKKSLAKWKKARRGELLTAMPENANDDYALIIDALFGIGLSRPLDAPMQKIVFAINRFRCPVLAIDTPSGLDADSGNILAAAVRATKTVTFFAAKQGLFTADGPDVAGEVVVRDLRFAECLPPPPGFLLKKLQSLDLSLLKRKQNSHKGMHGAVTLIGGAPGMLGALVLAARAAVRLGGGKVFAVCDKPPPLDWESPEIMWRKSPPQKSDCIAVGMGLGDGGFLQQSILSPAPLLIDADGLNQLAKKPKLKSSLLKRKSPTIITPHLAEAARLLSTTTESVQQNRIGAAKQLAKTFNAITVLKGAGTIICAPDGQWTICAKGNAGLAQAGAGDVLAGIIAALLAQSKDAFFAARAGCYLHGNAADILILKDGEIGLDINLLAATAKRVLNRRMQKVKPSP